MDKIDFIESKEERNRLISRTDVLEKVKALLLIPNTEMATREQVANYYEVSPNTIRTIQNRHMEELKLDGVKMFTKDEILRLLQSEAFVKFVKKERTGVVVTLEDDSIFKINNTGMLLFTKRAILRIGMVLTIGEIAAEIRTKLLDVYDKAEENCEEIIKSVVAEIDEESEALLNIVKAIREGNSVEAIKYLAIADSIRNKKIKELQEINFNITTNALTIIESKSVINKVVREIAARFFYAKFGMVWREFYGKLNYKLHININNRNREKGQSLLDTLSDEEIRQAELIARAWGTEMGLDVSALLKFKMGEEKE